MNSLFDVFFRDFLTPYYNSNESLCDEQDCKEVKKNLPCKNDNTWEDGGNHYFLDVFVPKNNDTLDVEVTNGCVNISYSTEVINDGNGYTHSYKSSGCMTCKLPDDANKSTLKAKKDDSFLRLTVEKVKPTTHSFKVEIE